MIIALILAQYCKYSFFRRICSRFGDLFADKLQLLTIIYNGINNYFQIIKNIHIFVFSYMIVHVLYRDSLSKSSLAKFYLKDKS